MINSSIYHERIDAIAQTIRLVFLIQFNKEKKSLKLYEYKLSQLLNILLKYQYQTNAKQKVKGSFSWGKKSDGKIVSHANSWVTFFSIQALYFYKDFLEGKKIKFDEFTFV